MANNITMNFVTAGAVSKKIVELSEEVASIRKDLENYTSTVTLKWRGADNAAYAAEIEKESRYMDQYSKMLEQISTKLSSQVSRKQALVTNQAASANVRGGAAAAAGVVAGVGAVSGNEASPSTEGNLTDRGYSSSTDGSGGKHETTEVSPNKVDTPKTPEVSPNKTDTPKVTEKPSTNGSAYTHESPDGVKSTYDPTTNKLSVTTTSNGGSNKGETVTRTYDLNTMTSGVVNDTSDPNGRNGVYTNSEGGMVVLTNGGREAFTVDHSTGSVSNSYLSTGANADQNINVQLQSNTGKYDAGTAFGGGNCSNGSCSTGSCVGGDCSVPTTNCVGGNCPTPGAMVSTVAAATSTASVSTVPTTPVSSSEWKSVDPDGLAYLQANYKTVPCSGGNC